MSGVETLLAEVLAAHERGPWVEVSDGLHRPSCSCGALLDAKARNESESRHRAAEQAKALREWLTSDATFLVAREAILNRPIPPYTGFGAARADARAVLAALTDLIGAES